MATWTAIRTGLTSGQKADFTTFLNYVFMVNGADATAIWDGNPAGSFVTTGNASGAPIGKYIENYRSRIWIAGNTTYPDRIYYSSVPSAEAIPVITWDTNEITGQWIDVSPSDGENITALHRTKTALLVFKNNHIYQIYSIESIDADPKINVGTWSKESIIETKNGVYFHHPTGFYLYSNGQIQEISQPIIDIVKNISLSNYDDIAGWVEIDGNHVCWSVGDVTIDGITYNNLVVRYTISTGVWTHYSYPTQFTASSPYNDGTNMYTVVGDESGNVFEIDTGLTDNGTPISFSLIHASDNLDGFDSTRKKVEKIYFSHTGGQGASVTYRETTDDKNDWSKKVCQLDYAGTGKNTANIEGRKIQIRLSGISKGEPFSYEGYEVLSGTTELITF